MSTAPLAAQTDVRAEAIDEPYIPAAWMPPPQPHEVADEQRLDVLIAHSPVSLSKRGTPGRRHEAPVGRGELEPIERRDGQDDLRLRGRELRDDAARAKQGARELLG